MSTAAAKTQRHLKLVHWTQRPENKEKIRKMREKANRTRKRHQQSTTHPSPRASHVADIAQDTFAYALGHVECWIEIYAKSSGVSAESLAAKLGAVLSVKSRG